MRKALLPIVVLTVLLVVPSTYWRAKRALLPSLGSTPTASERKAWTKYVAALQCSVLEPCFASSMPTAATCGKPLAVLEALQVPAEINVGARKNAEFVRHYWLAELAAFSKGKGLPLWRQQLDTCTGESVPAKLDQHFGLVAPGAVPAHCAELSAALAREASAESSVLPTAR